MIYAIIVMLILVIIALSYEYNFDVANFTERLTTIEHDLGVEKQYES